MKRIRLAIASFPCLKKLLLVTLGVVLVGGMIFTGCGQAASPSSSPPTAAKPPAAATTAVPAPVATTAVPAPAATKPAAATTAVPAPVATTAIPAPAPTTPAAAAIKKGGTLKIIDSPTGLQNAGGWPSALWGPMTRSPQFIIEPLLRGDNKGNVYPWLAESYKAANDLKSITFTLRKGVKFHDGTDFNAQAAKWNLDNTIAAGTNPYWASVDVIDDYTIRVNFNQWSNTLWSSFADGNASWMVSPSAFKAHDKDWMANNPIGTGPFKFASFERDVSYKMVKNPNYWRQGQPYLDAVNITYILDPMTQQAAMKSGDGMMCMGSDARIEEDYVKAGFKITDQTDSTMSLWMDSAHADSPYSKKEVRQAVEYALNKEAYAQGFSYGHWKAPYQIIGPASPVFDPNFTLGRKYDPAKAKQLLAQAGYPNGFKTTLLTGPFGLKDVMTSMQADLAAVGIQGEISIANNPGKMNQDSNTLTSVLILQPITSVGNANGALAFWCSTTSKTQMANWARPPEYVKLYDASMASPMPDINLQRAVFNYLTSEAMVIPVTSSTSFWAYAPFVMDGGFCERGMFPWLKPEQMWLNK